MRSSIRPSTLVLVAAFSAASAFPQSAPTPPSSPTKKPTMAPATKISGILECGKSQRTSLEVGDAPGHVLSIGKTPCRWTRAFLLGRLRTFKGESKSMRDIKGESGLERGYHVGRTGGKGDVYFFRFDGTVRTEDRTLQGRWSFTGGSGELEGLQGAGTYKGTFDDKGGSTIEMEGEYRLSRPAASEGTP